MLKIDQAIIDDLNAAEKLEDLHAFLQGAIALEHSTIPPYLTAEFSIKPGTNADVKKIIHSIVIQEMLHMTIACNILNALGGKPEIYSAGFVPVYPTTLPMNINTGLVVGLEKMSRILIEKTFMEIEEPEVPLVFPVVLEAIQPQAQEFSTIGQFYRTIQQKIMELSEDNLPGDPNLQVVSDSFTATELFPILTKADVIKAIDIIVEQGEGTDKLPFDLEMELAHYYRFQQIIMGKTLEDNNGVITFGDPAIVFDEASVFPLMANTKTIDLPVGSTARDISEQFNIAYSTLLKMLQEAFNGNPASLDDTIASMFDIQKLGKKLVALPHPAAPGFNTGPSFEFVLI
ncbi:ferritin-like domain-containing protein [Mucilaginibacter rubeus]|uniref:ferritin-like domain-containing protein n=1 Tax=Mucilaginibacter rubeus TaxID=2027860 RepID=UPI00166AF939|nr:ferritin-like protein [Mucilaginibacter rubeus]GGA95991.1 hypothetical protein GCM10011500_09700 [Mucilaginibacter rubeus]